MHEQHKDAAEVLAEYERRLAAFKRDTKKLGIRVKVTATLGPYTSTVEGIQRKQRGVRP